MLLSILTSAICILVTYNTYQIHNCLDQIRNIQCSFLMINKNIASLKHNK